MSRVHRLVLGFVLFVASTASLVAQPLPAAAPEEVGLSSRRLARIGEVVQKHVDRHQIAGAVTMVLRKGKVAHFETFGLADREAGKAMSTDTIFRIASMTKPITSLAVTMLHEEGHFLLDDPVSRFIPEFKNPRVLPAGDSEHQGAGEPVRREITIRHLLNHTSGLTYHWNPRIGKRYTEAGIGHGLLQDENVIAEDVRALAEFPLVNHPGEKFEYGLNIDVLGHLVEVVSGLSLDEFFRTRIFGPLGMKDTHFYLPPEKVGRLAAVYAPAKGGGLERLPEEPVVTERLTYSASYPYQGPRRYFSGGGGLCSTASDYARFLQMFLNGGELDGVRLLSRKTVELMTRNSMGDLSQAPGFRFGLGFSVLEDPGRAALISSEGTYGWGGFWYTHFWVDPKEELIGILLSQLYPNNHLQLRGTFQVLVTQAIVD